MGPPRVEALMLRVGSGVPAVGRGGAEGAAEGGSAGAGTVAGVVTAPGAFGVAVGAGTGTGACATASGLSRLKVMAKTPGMRPPKGVSEG